MEELKNFIVQAVFSNDNTQRSAAERQLNEVKERNPNLFFETIVAFLADVNEKAQFRQACGTLIRNAIVFNTTDSCNWLKVDPQIREPLKVKIVETLLSTDLIVKKAAANVFPLLNSGRSCNLRC